MPPSTTKPPGVLFVLQSVAAGGMETHVVDLAAEYVRRGIETNAIVPSNADLDAVAARLIEKCVPAHRLDTDARRGRLVQVKQLWRTFRLMRRLRPGVVHVQTGGATGGAAAVLLGRLAGARVVITEHDVPTVHPGRRQRLARQILDGACHAIIAVSRRNGALRLERLGGPKNRFAAILNGVPVLDVESSVRAVNRAAIRHEFGIRAEAVVLGSVVRLAEGKGLHDLFEAFARIKGDDRLRMLLVGDGPLKEGLVAMAANLGIEGKVIMAGHRDDPERFLDAMDLFVLPVPAGSMSIALLEAMARGVAPMITFCGPEEAVIPDISGYCAPPSDPEGLARAMAAAVGDVEALRAMGELAARHTRRHFSVARVADDTLQAYACHRGALPERLRVDGPPNRYPGGLSAGAD